MITTEMSSMDPAAHGSPKDRKSGRRSRKPSSTSSKEMNLKIRPGLFRGERSGSPVPGSGDLTSPRKRLAAREGASAAEMDEERKTLKAYDYLCRIGEAKEWIEACIGEQIEPIEEMEEGLRYGIALAKLARFLDANSVRKICEDRTRLQFKHVDNINFLYRAMRTIGLPEIFFFETADCYDKKNIPKVIYCIHALSYLCARKGITPHIQNLTGKLQFTDEQLQKTNQSLQEAGVQLPAFGDIGNALAKELKETEEERLLRLYGEDEDDIILVQSLVRAKLARNQFIRNKAALIAAREERIRKEEEERRRQEEELRRQEEERIRLEEERRRQEEEERRRQEEERLRQEAERLRLAKEQRWNQLMSNSDNIAKVQALWRGRKLRRAYLERMGHLKSHVDAIAKLQATIRAKNQQQAYKNLTLNNPDVKSIHTFAKLLEDSETDFADELELDRLRKQVVKRIRENIVTENELAELDTKIALLISNRMTLEEVIHLTSKQMKTAEARREAKTNGFSLRHLDKQNFEKLQRYKELFFLLQTQPGYLAKMMYSLSQRAASNVVKTLENVILTLFGYGQNIREEYLFLGFIKSAIQHEISETKNITDFIKGNPFFIRLVLQLTRGAREQQYLRETLTEPIKHLLSMHDISIETDPVNIYKRLIQDEEVQTGEKSKRKYDVDAHQAVQDEAVRRTFIQNIEKLKNVAEEFMNAIIKSLDNMPFGMRYIAKELRSMLEERFPDSQEEVDKVIANLLYYRYMNPAIVAPESFSVLSTSVLPQQRKNLAEVAKLLQYISIGKMSADAVMPSDDMHRVIQEFSPRMKRFFKDACTVPPAEEHFEIDEYFYAARNKPSIVINLQEIITVHAALIETADVLATNPQDPLRILLAELGSPPNIQDDERAHSQEINLTLVNRFSEFIDSDFSTRQLFIESKKLVFTIIRVQTGKNLVDVLERPTTEKEERAYAQILDADRAYNARRRSRAFSMPSQNSSENIDRRSSLVGSSLLVPGHSGTLHSQPSLMDNSAGSTLPENFAQLKKIALENMNKLEIKGKVSRENNYQDMLNSIAKDILYMNKHRQRRIKEMFSLQNTLKTLDDRYVYMEEQKKSYNDYVKECLKPKGTRDTKAAAPKPFTKHWSHFRELQKAGSMPKFGSFRYTAADLYRKGVLVSLDGYSPRQYGQITLTISSNEPGIFNIDVSLLGIKLPNTLEVRLEDLLQSQFNGTTVLTLFEGARVNVNLMIYLLNKKFYGN